MLWCLFSLVLSLLLQFGGSEDKYDVLCPVSKTKGFTDNGDYHYPIQMYNASLQGAKSIACRSFIHQAPVDYTCPVNYLGCPVIVENLHDWIETSSKWKKATDLCTLKDSLANEKINTKVVVFGGSVTFGQETEYCCNKAECNHEPKARCAWPHYFEHWLQSISKNKVKVYNFGQPGVTSSTMSDTFHATLDDAGITNLTSHDIVIIDHSFNDNAMGSNLYYAELHKGLERLIRSIYEFSGIANPPQIIIFESETKTGFLGYNASFSYHLAYRELAEYYGIRLYSYKEAVNSNHSKVLQHKYHSHLTHELRRVHPPWNVHLFYADFIAGIILSELNSCPSDVSVTHTRYVLPPALTAGTSDVSYCRHDKPPLVKLSYEDIIEHKAVGHYNIPRKDTWHIGLDHKQRGGILMELKESSDFKEVDNAPIILDLGITMEEYLKTPIIVLKIEYMRSYTNAGYVTVGFCGKVFNRSYRNRPLDALWTDYKFHQYSLPEVWSVNLSAQPDLKTCSKSNKGNVTVELYFRVQGYQGSMTDLIATEPRKSQMFKINSIRICEY